jgi:integrase
MRRGELVALRWKDIDLDGGKLRVEQSIEQTKTGLRFKSPKTKHGRRTIAIPPAVVADLRAHWKAAQEQRRSSAWPWVLAAARRMILCLRCGMARHANQMRSRTTGYARAQ